MITARACKRRQGFTLIEVLVAVAVIGFTIPALLALMVQQTDYAGVIRDKTIASWIAENKATELRLERVFLNNLVQREEFEQIEMAGAEWAINVDIQNTEGSTLVLYEIKVNRVEEGADGSEDPLVTLETYLHGT